jgi:hypothetical protein
MAEMNKGFQVQDDDQQNAKEKIAEIGLGSGSLF